MDYWTSVLFIGFIGATVYLSYMEGLKKGLKNGCEFALDNLMDEKIIHIDNDGEIQQWDKYYDK